ncbi:heavy metal translocating P-type ATPase [Mycobacterium sp. CPCC 205372]|uniref:Heavy metal translocating P-type ATPase n=1 Tax=Mycobacterium hippophais TaxID=3016340 RepID=A0ABT4PV09_9MYCO|nr:heavy metal translocating P-type ATPase [Mycobacterium hippophais]MCZ8380334.1 heavy metal translocating P-type ATPase [Mycobacterium hippophais]
MTTAEAAAPTRSEPPAGWRAACWSVASVRWATVALGLFAAGAVAQLAGLPDAVWWTLYLACYVTGGWAPALEGLQALRERRLDVDLLMIVAAIGAAAIGQIFDGALLIVIFATSGALEDVATGRTRDSVRSLLNLAPERAVRVGPGGAETTVAAADLVVGDEVVVRPGERISADGTVTEGASDVDQASITGEPMPVTRAPGDEVYAGTLNGPGALRIRVSREPSQTVVARIVAMVAEASATKAHTQLFIEKVEQRYSVAVVVATTALFIVPLLAGADLQSTLLRAMTFMIVASPCAIVLATMPPLLSAIANAGRHGVLVKSAVAMERLADTTVVAFDKTGTLTHGTPTLTEVTALDGRGADDLLRCAAAAEQYSEHPIGRAIFADARRRGLTVPRSHGFRALPGRGVSAEVDGRRIAVLAGAEFSDIAHVVELERTGATVVVLTVDDRAVGVLGLTDRMRSDAARAVASIRDLTDGDPVVLTGDHRAAAEHLADAAGIADVRAGLLPADKVDAVRALQADGRRVLLVGDGINDAPAMAAAHTSIAMGRSGADLSIETADAVTVRDDLSAIPAVVALAKRARRVVVANLVIAATVIVTLVTWDLVGHLPLPLGVAGHEGSTILVALNGLRLLSNRAWRTAAGR